MTCDEVDEIVEAVAAGDLPMDAALTAHLDGCPGCAAALATARRIENYFATRSAVAAPEQFTRAVLQRIRRERWQSEEQVDRLFNFAMVAAGLLLVLGAAVLFNMSVVLHVAATASQLLTVAAEQALRQVAPAIGTYVAATALLASALGMWWWADAAQ